jgi:hypothetical protein
VLLRRSTLDAIAAGEVGLVFRRWKRPTVKEGGTLTTKVGVLAIDKVEVVDPARISEREAKRAGFASADALRAELERYGDGDVYRVALRRIGDDPRIALRKQSRLTKADVEELTAKLARMDKNRAWTRATLELIEEYPARRAPDLAEMLGYETKVFKPNVRKLKALGLTESLDVGYRLSPRGRALLRQLPPRREA